jgi:hypothetical protein
LGRALNTPQFRKGSEGKNPGEGKSKEVTKVGVSCQNEMEGIPGGAEEGRDSWRKVMGLARSSR